MIVSVSRRTDLPAFYSEWFFNRLEEGYCYVVNPMNPKQVSKIVLTPETVDCFVFWTKDAGPMLEKLHLLEQYNYYFQFTLTPYEAEIEKGIVDKAAVVKHFRALASKIGKERVVWRYDPILITDKYSLSYHVEAFEALCKALKGATTTCVLSFIDLYRKTARNTKGQGIREVTLEEIHALAKGFSGIAKRYDITLQTCSEAVDLSDYGITKGACIDRAILEQLGIKISAIKKETTQRESCGCVKSVDIGQYNTCLHHCTYCYANFNHEQVKKGRENHNVMAPLLSGNIREDAKITERN